MLKKLMIKNFKAIQNMTIEFTPLTVLIGGEFLRKKHGLAGAGFSAFRRGAGHPEYLREKGWTFEEIKSNTGDGENKPIEFIAAFMFSGNTVEWYFAAGCDNEKWSTREFFRVNGKGVISYRVGPGIFNGLMTADTPEPFKNIKLESSVLKIIDDYLKTMCFGKDEIFKLKSFLWKSVYFGLLSPERMRSGNRNIYDDIGPGGESLAAYINGMSKDHKKELEEDVSGIIGSKIGICVKDINGRFIVHTLEKFGNDTTETAASHISDGLLRIIAFSVIMQKTKTVQLALPQGGLNFGQPGSIVTLAEEDLRNGMILLDEIENGINPYLTERLAGLFRGVVAGTNRQVIVTTHSPVILNDFVPEEVVFLWKDKNGAAHCEKMFSTEKMREALGFLNPGEIWENYGKDAILTKLVDCHD
jgi:hypothetical protein